MRKTFLFWYLILMGLLAVLMPKVLCAKTIVNVFSENPEHKIYIDDNFSGKGAVSNYEVIPGTHYVKVLEDQDIVYTKIVEVEKDKSHTLAVDRFIDYKAETSLPNRAAKNQEARRLRKAKGNFAFGVNGSYLPGVSAKLFLTDRIGIQASGWLVNYDDYYHRSLELRGMVSLVDTVIMNFPGQLYFAGGQGRCYTPGNISTITDAALGIEFSLASMNSSKKNEVHVYEDRSIQESLMFGVINAGSSILGSLLTLDNAYFNIELGVGYIEESNNPDYFGMTGRIGLHYYF